MTERKTVFEIAEKFELLISHNQGGGFFVQSDELYLLLRAYRNFKNTANALLREKGYKTYD